MGGSKWGNTKEGGSNKSEKRGANMTFGRRLCWTGSPMGKFLGNSFKGFSIISNNKHENITAVVECIFTSNLRDR